MSNVIHTDPETDSRPGNDEIAALAYQLWMDRGCPIGSPEEDWFLAEKELTQKASSATA